jgi:hypothetical protein
MCTTGEASRSQIGHGGGPKGPGQRRPPARPPAYHPRCLAPGAASPRPLQRTPSLATPGTGPPPAARHGAPAGAAAAAARAPRRWDGVQQAGRPARRAVLDNPTARRLGSLQVPCLVFPSTDAAHGHCWQPHGYCLQPLPDNVTNLSQLNHSGRRVDVDDALDAAAAGHQALRNIVPWRPGGAGRGGAGANAFVQRGLAWPPLGGPRRLAGWLKPAAPFGGACQQQMLDQAARTAKARSARERCRARSPRQARQPACARAAPARAAPPWGVRGVRQAPPAPPRMTAVGNAATQSSSRSSRRSVTADRRGSSGPRSAAARSRCARLRSLWGGGLRGRCVGWGAGAERGRAPEDGGDAGARVACVARELLWDSRGAPQEGMALSQPHREWILACQTPPWRPVERPSRALRPWPAGALLPLPLLRTRRSARRARGQPTGAARASGAASAARAPWYYRAGHRKLAGARL